MTWALIFLFLFFLNLISSKNKGIGLAYHSTINYLPVQLPFTKLHRLQQF